MKNLFSAFLAATYLSASLADVYLHAPRGSNNRCDEKSNNRNNDERCFDSENNAAGGYSVADQEMFFYEGTVLPIEWYSQHACGNGAELKDDPNNPESVHCQIILQLGCEPDFAKAAGAASGVYRLTDGISLGRPGADKPEEIAKNPEAVYDTFGDTCTQTQPTTATCAKQNANNDQCNALNLANGGDRGTFNSATCQCSTRKLQTYCNYEPEAYYQKCAARERNKGLFTATQNPNNNGGATKTRQEPNSDRYGFECTEERDYYPYFAETLFRDVAVITTDITKCEYYQTNSQNVVDKCECAAAATATAEEQAKAQFHNQKVPCEAAGYTWKCSGSFNWRKPDCRLSAAQADNALGRIDTRGDNVDEVDGSRMAHYDWLIDSDLIPAGETEVRCQLRLRYNISTGEILDTFDVNDNKKIEQNPVFTVGAANGTAEKTMPLRMAINTAQYGRTFEDRTYVFAIRKRPAELQGKTIHNLNVRGKRGNIAQVRNCVEYDFLPNILNVEPGDYVHFQWAGSDYNANGNAGEGRDGTDRSNIIGVTNYDGNLVTPLNATEKYVQLFNQDDLTTLAWLGQDPKNCYTTTEMLTTKKNNGNDPKSCHFLNGVRNAAGKPTAYFNHIAQVQTTGVFKYISSRNNNFSNRSQKGQIISGGKKSTLNIPLIAGAAAGSVAGVALLAGLGFLVYKKGLPGNSKV